MLSNLSPAAQAAPLPTLDRTAVTALTPQNPLPPVDSVSGGTAGAVGARDLQAATAIGAPVAAPGPADAWGDTPPPVPLAPVASRPSREPGTQTLVGDLQQGADYLDRLAVALQDVKRQISGALAQGGAAAPALQQAVDALDTLWQARDADAGALVDGQLQVADGQQPVQQRFRIRGLDAASLIAGGGEVLRLRLAGQSGAIRATLDGGSLASSLKALQQALAPTGLQVATDGTDIWFSVAESRWPAVRDSLSVQGDGRRFPGGQPVRPVIDQQPSALDVGRWKLGSTADQRQTLRSVVWAQTLVDQAQRRIGNMRKGLLNREPVPDLDSAQASASAADVQAQLQGADYGQLAALVPALRGLYPARVRQILSA